MPLSHIQRNLLALSRQDIEKAGFPFFVSEFWRTEAARFERCFEQFGINDVEGEIYNTRFHGITQDDVRLYEWFLTCYYRLLKQRDSLDLLNRIHATLQKNPDGFRQYQLGDMTVRVGYPVTVDGKTLSADLLFTVNDFYNLLELNADLATEPVIVADLGAGWGRVGHMLLQLNPRATYVVFDIPESLVISSTYLPARLPGLSVSDYAEVRGIKTFDRATLKQHSMWFLGPQHMAQLAPGALDVVLNVASFQEMTPEQVGAYLQLFDEKLNGGHVYLRNDKKHSMCSWPQYQLPPRWRQIFERDSIFSNAIVEAGFQVPLS